MGLFVDDDDVHGWWLMIRSVTVSYQVGPRSRFPTTAGGRKHGEVIDGLLSC
jgi:hypothetical protein